MEGDLERAVIGSDGALHEGQVTWDLTSDLTRLKRQPVQLDCLQHDSFLDLLVPLKIFIGGAFFGIKMSFSVEYTSSCTLQRAGLSLSRKFKRTGFSHTAAHLSVIYFLTLFQHRKGAEAILRSPSCAYWSISRKITGSLDRIQHQLRTHLTKSD